ncbi:unnamed protein product [Symbiodinium sp. CCMP2456]|nr:unnamed protein product [Symbiodinium sp. CCMP2456]
MASGDPVLWAAQRQAKIAAARALREQHRDGLTEQHTFHPKCLPRRPPSGSAERETPETQSRPPQKACLPPRRVARASSRGASPSLSRLPDAPEGPIRLPKSESRTEGSGGYAHGNVLPKPPKCRVRGPSPSPIAQPKDEMSRKTSSPRRPQPPRWVESRHCKPSEAIQGGVPAEDQDLCLSLLGTSRFIAEDECEAAGVLEASFEASSKLVCLDSSATWEDP